MYDKFVYIVVGEYKYSISHNLFQDCGSNKQTSIYKKNNHKEKLKINEMMVPLFFIILS